jgi:hypothetical protein
MIIDVGVDFKTIIDVIIALAVVVNAFFTRKVREEISSMKADIYTNFMTKDDCRAMMNRHEDKKE